MASTRTGSESGIIDWFLAHPGRDNPAKSAHLSPSVAHYLGYSWPMTINYTSPINPVFLLEIESVEKMNAHPIWLARDGLVPLLWFMRTHPDPGKFKGRLLVHERLAPFVPRAWRGSCGTYRTESTNEIREPKGLFLSGIVCDHAITLPELERQLADIIRRVGRERLGKLDIQILAPCRSHEFECEHEHDYPLNYGMMLARMLGPRVRAVSFRDAEVKDDYRGYWVAELNEHMICADNGYVHGLLSRAATLLPDAKRLGPGKEETVPLSPYHCMKVRLSLSGKSVHDARGKELETLSKDVAMLRAAMVSNAQMDLPWPKWFGTWGRALNGGRGASRE